MVNAVACGTYMQDYLYLPNSLLTSFANNDGSSSLPYFSNKGPAIPSYLCLCLRIVAPPNNVKNANRAPVCRLTTKLVFRLRPPTKPQRKLIAPYSQLDPFRKSRPFTEATVTTKKNPARLRAITNVFIFNHLLRITLSFGIRLPPKPTDISSLPRVLHFLPIPQQTICAHARRVRHDIGVHHIFAQAHLHGFFHHPFGETQTQLLHRHGWIF